MKLKLTIHEAVIILSALGLLLDVNTSNTSEQEINDLINKICNLKHINIDPNVLKTNKLRKKRKININNNKKNITFIIQ